MREAINGEVEQAVKAKTSEIATATLVEFLRQAGTHGRSAKEFLTWVDGFNLNPEQLKQFLADHSEIRVERDTEGFGQNTRYYLESDETY